MKNTPNDLGDTPDDNTIRCPICKKDPQETECSHLLIHGDDLRTRTLITDCGPRGAWETLQAEGRRLPDFASDFLEKYAKHFPSVADTTGNDWEGGAPGLSGNYSYIWVKSSDDFQAELIKFLKSEKIH